MPVIAMTPATSQPYYPADDRFLSPASMPSGGLAPESATKPETVTVTAPASTDDTGKSFFDNLLDVVNPLEHLPIVSTIYSNLTGDKPNDFTQVAGDTLYGGPLGLVSSVGNLIFKDITGKSVGDTVWGWVTNKGGDTRMASNDAPRQAVKPSSDMFSFLHANIGTDYDSNSTQLASNTKPTSPSTAASATPVVTAPIITAPAAPVQTAAASQTQTTAPSSTTSTTAASAAPRLLNPLPMRGAPPMHANPSDNVRAAGMASMVAKRAHMHAPMSEGNAPAIVPAGSAQGTDQPAQPPAQIASSVPPNIPVGADGIPQLDHNGEEALLAALNKNGISSAIGQQAMMAYQKTMAMTPDPSNAAALAATMH